MAENPPASQEGPCSMELVNSPCANNDVRNTLVLGCNVTYTALRLGGDCFDLYIPQFVAGHREHNRVLCLVQK